MKTIEKKTVNDFAEFKIKKSSDNLVFIMIKVTSTGEAHPDQWAQVQSIFDTYAKEQVCGKMVIDLSQSSASTFSLPYIQRWSVFFKDNRKYLRECLTYVAFVSDSTLFRTVFSVAISLSPPQIPFHVVASKKELP